MSTSDARRADPTADAIRAERAEWQRADDAAFEAFVSAAPASWGCRAAARSMSFVREALTGLSVALAHYVAHGQDPLSVPGEYTASLTARIAAGRAEAEARGAEGRLSRFGHIARARGALDAAEAIDFEPQIPDAPSPGPLECGEVRIAEDGDNHDGGTRTGYHLGTTPMAACHAPVTHMDREEPHDFSRVRPATSTVHGGPAGPVVAAQSRAVVSGTEERGRGERSYGR